MTINTLTETYLGKPVVDFQKGDTITKPADDVVYRLNVAYDTGVSQTELMQAFVSQIDPSQVQTLIIGEWDEAFDEGPEGFLDYLIEHQQKFTNLTALFVGDMTYEQCEMSWITQTDYTKLLVAYPKLESLRIRGSNSLSLSAVTHENLTELAIESGGLPNDIVNAIAKSNFPKLKRLELWLGDEGYGFDGQSSDYEALLSAVDASRLEYLGLKNAYIADELAQYVAHQTWVKSLQTLDLSLGVVTDKGAESLCNSPYLTEQGLGKLDLHHHFVSDEWQQKLKALPCDVDISDAQEPDEYDGEVYYYVAVSE